MKMIENEMNVTVHLEIIKASEIEPKEVKWLWYPYIPFGKVTLLQGDPGNGKSKLMLSIAALLSKGEPLPFTDEEETEPMTIIYQTTEDDADDTVVPRFNSAGGNGENLIFIKEDEKSLSFGDNRIREAIEMYHAKLLILDPMSSYIGESCSMNNANETRAEFNHLIAVAKDTGCAIVIIAHMNKMRDTNPLYDDPKVSVQKATYEILKSERMDDMECVKVDYKEFEAMTIQHSKDLLQEGELRATSEIGRDEAALNGLSRAEVERGVLYHAQGILEDMGLENEVELLAARVHDNRFPAGHIQMFDLQYWHRALRLADRLTICDWQKRKGMHV